MRTATTIALVCVALLLIAAGPMSLPDQEAIRLIRESEGYPQLESIRLSGWIEGWIKEDSPLGRELARLVGEGLLIPVPGTFWRYEPTGKGKDLVDKSVWKNYYNKEWENFDPLAYKWDVTKIVDKRIDKERGIATVIYEIVSTPTPYLTELRKIDPATIDAVIQDRMTQLGSKADRRTAKASFELWESGWRIRK